MGSRCCANTCAACCASCCQGRPRISEALIMAAAVALVYVLVALPYSGPARMGRLCCANCQHLLASLLQIRPRGRSLPTLDSSTSSALSPEVVRRTESAALGQIGML